MLWDSIRYNLSNLITFSGRGSRKRFWPYAGIVLAAGMVGILLLVVPEMNAAMARMQRFAAEHPELATETVGPGSYLISIEGNHPELLPDIMGLARRMGLMFVAPVLLLGAAVTRRLHDINRSGWWALLPFPFLAFSFAEMPRVFSDIGDTDYSTGMLLTVSASNLLYNALLIGVIVFLGFRSSGPNRFGDRPD